MSLSLYLSSFFNLEVGQLQGLQACGVQPNTQGDNTNVKLSAVVTWENVPVEENAMLCVMIGIQKNNPGLPWWHSG